MNTSTDVATHDAMPDTTGRREVEVTVGNPPWALPGTLSLPAADRPVPGVVVVHGSGPHDRDGTIGPNKPYRDLAEGLVAAGIATLRYDKRTLVHRTELASLGATLTVDDEVVDDALAAVDLLRGTRGVHPEAVFVLGHSLGGYLGPRIVSRAPAVRGLIVLAGNSRGLAEVILDQTETIALMGGPTPEAAAAIESLRRQVAVVASPALTAETPPTELPFGVPASYWLDLRAYEPVALAAALDRPILVMQGGRDYQVTAADFEGWRAGLASRVDATFRWFPEMSHLFIAGEGPASPGDYVIPGQVAAVVIDTIAAWIGGITGPA
jgi:uncharacterized protein